MKLLAMLMLAADLNGQPLPDVVLLDFTAGYCGPCQQMVPVLQRMEKDQFPIRKIDITEQPDVSRQYRVDRIPTLVLLVEGKEVKRFVGLTAESELRQAMNEAARGLDGRRRQAVVASQPQTAGTTSAEDNDTVADADPRTAFAEDNFPEEQPQESRGGIRGMFDRVKNGLTGGGRSRPPLERPDFRAQSPEDSSTSDHSAAMDASVRVRVVDGKMLDFGTGTVVHSAVGQSIVVTCAHLFQNVDGKAAVIVDVFRNGTILSYPAKVLGGDHEADVAILQIQNKEVLPTVPVAFDRSPLEKDEALFSIGCSNGNLPTEMTMSVIEVNRYIGPSNILCTNDPSQGRSGGGLFDAGQRLVGVCSAADRKAKEGLYAGAPAVKKLLEDLNLMTILKGQSDNFPLADTEDVKSSPPENPFAAASADAFDELFDSAPPVDKGTRLASTSNNSPFTEDTRTEQELPDPFTTPPVVRTTATTSVASDTEITVIIDAKDSTQGKKVIVIPKASPWLLELLTGESPSTSRQQNLSATSSRTRDVGSKSAPDFDFNH